MIISSPMFCVEDIRTPQDMHRTLKDVLSHFSRMAYVMRLVDFYLHNAWIEEVELNHGDCATLRICGKTGRYNPNHQPEILPAKLIDSGKPNLLRDIVVKCFRDSFSSVIKELNGPIPDYAVSELKSKLESFESVLT